MCIRDRALAELDGVGNAQKIIDALQPLRDRVGMPPVDFDREYNCLLYTSPFDGVGTASTNSLKSASVLIMRGKPRIDIGGSSG